MATRNNSRWSVRHVETVAELPAKLTIGRAYFVDDEQYIVVDHGNGPVIYGSRTGAQGIPGEPLPQIQAQINYLTESVVSLVGIIDNTCDKLRNAEAILLKTILEQDAAHTVSPITAQETLTAADGSTWNVLDSSGTSTEGTIIFSLNQ